jgi:hypothetical protein
VFEVPEVQPSPLPLQQEVKIEKTEEPIKENKEPVDTSVTEADDNITALDNGDKIEWYLKTDIKHHEEFYAEKRKAHKVCMIGGALPFDRYRKELLSFRPKIHVSYDREEIYNNMIEIVEMKTRATEIVTRLNTQLFRWKRYMEMLRAKASVLDGTKVAQADAAAIHHLGDFEHYYANVVELNKTAEEIMKNLECAWDTLNRGVTIILEAQKHDRGMTRYDNTAPYTPSPVQKKTDKDDFDDLLSLDTGDGQPKTKKAVIEGWDF